MGGFDGARLAGAVTDEGRRGDTLASKSLAVSVPATGREEKAAQEDERRCMPAKQGASGDFSPLGLPAAG